MISRIIKIAKFFLKEGRGVRFCPPVFFLAFALSSCGIGSYPVLYEPVVTSPSSTSPITFFHDYRNDPDAFLVLGYDIYYRIYNDEVTVSDDTIKNDAAAELNEKAIGNLLAKNWNEMDKGHYRRIYLSEGDLDKTAPPAFLITSSTPQNFSIYLYLEGADSYIKNDFDSSSTLYFSRYLGEAAGNPVTEEFSTSDFSSDDPDVFETATTYRVAFFALTYGLTNDLRSLHSSIVYIGSYKFN